MKNIAARGDRYKDNMQGKPGVDREYLVWDCGLYTVQRAVRTRTHLMVRTYEQMLKGHCIPDPVEEILRERVERAAGSFTLRKG